MKTMMYAMLDKRANPEMLGYLPSFLNEDDPRPAREQLDANYQHGGGWRPMDGWTFDPKTLVIRFPGDPTFRPYAMTTLHGKETILFYLHDWVLIQQEDDSFEIARMN